MAPTPSAGEGEIQCLETLAVNHMRLSQLELTRAALRDLARVSPFRAAAFLRRILDGGQAPPGVLWRDQGYPSMCHLRWFCSQEYLHAVSLCFNSEAQELHASDTVTGPGTPPSFPGARADAHSRASSAGQRRSYAVGGPARRRVF